MKNKKNKFKNVLVLYKRSAYSMYFLQKDGELRQKANNLVSNEIQRFKKAHDQHYATLKKISHVLLSLGVNFTETYRGRKVDYSKYDLIITVGGDGTFLEASKHVNKQAILGVNSAPSQSVGNFCIARINNFEEIFTKIQNNKCRTIDLQRLSVQFHKSTDRINALNDVLICHQNPAMLSRYCIEFGAKKEEQRSSGLWISSASGSTGAIHSAGGEVLKRTDARIQYRPRELYQGIFPKYKLTGKVLPKNVTITVTSIMRKGKLFVDGARQNYDFNYGTKVKISLSPDSIKTFAQ